MSQISEKEEFTTSKWKVFSGFHCEYDCREWEDELLARLRIKRVDNLVDESYLNINPPTNAEARADVAKMIFLKGYTLAMGTIPAFALKELRNKYLEGKSDDDFVELMDMWKDFKPIPREADTNGLLDLMLELNERMEDVHLDLKREPIELYAKYKRQLHKDYDPCITTFKLACAPSPYRPINQKKFDELGRAIQNYWKAHFKKDESTIVNKAEIYNLSGNLKCDHCGKTNHTAYKDGKPFCFKSIKDLKKDNTTDVNKPKSVRCRYCKNEGHEISNCPKLLKKKANDESGLNHLFIGSIDSDVTYTDRNIFNLDTGNFVNVLADSGASMHVWPSDRDSPLFKTAKMANGTSCDINDIRDVLTMDELGTKIC